MRYLIIENNIVINAIVWDGITEYETPNHILLVQNDHAKIGDIYNEQENIFISKE